VLEKESNEKSKLVNARLDEPKKGEKTPIREEDKKRERKMNQGRDETPENKKNAKESSIKDDRMGTIIDVLK
jgi:hypothetical protein